MIFDKSRLSDLATVNLREVRRDDPVPLQFSIGTLLTDIVQYERMLRSFAKYGLHDLEAEFLYIDNRSSNRFDAYEGLTLLLAHARGKFVILCHQDVELIGEGLADLQRKLDELDAIDSTWAVAGNSGGAAPGVRAIRISDPIGEDQRVGSLPAQVSSLDENFLVIRRAAMIGFSRDIAGFHFYGTDICQQARLRGWSSWVIDFHLRHHSRGSVDAIFHESQNAFERKYKKIGAALRIQTSCAEVLVSGTSFDRACWTARRRAQAIARFLGDMRVVKNKWREIRARLS